MCSHIPNRGEQMARYYGYYSSVSRGKRQMVGNDDAVPCILDAQGDEKTSRRTWARLIQKIYEVDPPVCPKSVSKCLPDGQAVQKESRFLNKDCHQSK